jgi:hypothetical protein
MAASQTGWPRDMSDRGYSFASFDIELKRRGRGRWKWSVCTRDGRAVMYGSECSRAGARYKAERALFLLLCASASRLPRLPPEQSDPSLRAAAAIYRARARSLDSRTTTEGLRQLRKPLSEMSRGSARRRVRSCARGPSGALCAASLDGLAT